MNYSKNIFDYRKLPSEVKKQLKLDLGPNDVFTNKIRELFSIAKEQNIKDLSPDQITVAYYRKYTKENKKDIKTSEQIRAKLLNILASEKEYLKNHPDSQIKRLKRVNYEKETYTIE